MGTERRLWVVYVVMAAMMITIGFVAIRSVRATNTAAEELVTTHVSDMLEIERLRAAIERESRSVRGYLLSPGADGLARLAAAEQQVNDSLDLLDQPHEDAEHGKLVTSLRGVIKKHEGLLEAIVAERQATDDSATANRRFEASLLRQREELDQALSLMAAHEARALAQARAQGLAAANRAVVVLLLVALAAMLFAGGTGVFLARALKALAAHRELLERRNRELDAFAGQVAHDLRNVLSPVFIATSQIRHEAGENERVAKNADRLDRAGRRATRMLDGMLAFARAAGAPGDPGSASMRAVVAEVIEDLSELTRKVDATIVTEVADVTVACAPAVLHVVISNVVSNALKAVAGRPERRVRVTAAATDTWCELTVEDTGAGIPAEHLSRVFEPFFRVPGTAGAGSGIGLATVQRVVEAHRGTVSIASPPGGGTTFRARLPLAVPPTPPPPP